MKHYLEALFSVEYFPFWEGTMFFFLLYFVSISIRLSRMENKLSFQNKIIRNDLKSIRTRTNLVGNSGEAAKKKTSASTTSSPTTRTRTTVSGMGGY